MYCSKCGNLLKESDKFCPKCGTKVEESKPDILKEASEDRSYKKTNNQKKKKIKHPFWMAFLLANVVIACGIGIFRPDLYEKWDKESEELESELEKEKIIIGEFNSPVEYEGMEYIIKDFSFEDTMGGLSRLSKPEAGNYYLVLHIDVKNISNSTKNINDTVFYILYDDEIKYYGSFAAYTDFYQYNDSIIALGSLSDKIINFEVPAEVKDGEKKVQLVLERNKWNSDKSVYWDLDIE